MGLTGLLREVSVKTCPHCKKEYGKHSKKGFMKCLYTANFNLYNAHIEIQKLKNEKIVVEDGKFEVETPEGMQTVQVPEGTKVEMVENEKFAGEKIGQ